MGIDRNWNLMHFGKITDKFDLAGKICLVMLAPAIVLSITPAVILFLLTVFFSIFSGRFSEKFNFITHNPVALVILLFFALSLIGATYSTAPISEILITIRKYSKYLLALTFLPLFREERWRNYAVNSFLIGVLLLLVLSYLNQHVYLHIESGEFIYFLVSKTALNRQLEILKISMVFNFLLIFAAYLCLLKFTTKKGAGRFIWIIFFTLLVYTALFRSVGRTAYVIFAGLMLLFFIQKFSWRGLVSAFTSLALLFSLAFIFSSIFRERVGAVVAEIKIYRKDHHTSTGERMKFVENSITLIKKHPFFGTGSGSYFKEYAAIVPDNTFSNPHNEYVHVAVQFGILGLIVLLLFFVVPLWYSRFLPENEKYLVQGIVISVMIGSLANCWLQDMTIRCCYAYFVVLSFAALPPTKFRRIFRTKGGSYIV